MPKSRIYLPVPVPRGSRHWRAALAAAVGSLLLVGSACVETADVAPTDATEEPEAQGAIFPYDGSKPEGFGAVDVLGQKVTLIEGEWTRLEGHDTEVATARDREQAPDWVTSKLAEDSEPPKLGLSWPVEGTTVKDSYVVFSGTADPGATVSAGAYSAVADEHGEWSIGLVLSGGDNTATFHTVDEHGIGSTKSVTVYFESKDGAHDTWKDPNLGFEAWQKYGSCGDSVPYDIFKGKAEPGTTITVTSPFGGGKAVAGVDGYWKVKVTFEAAPVGEPFTVTVTDGTETKTFTFTRKESAPAEQPAPSGFEALWQKFGVSREAVPYEVFEGRTTPGTLVTASSPYGSGQTESNADGGWRIKLEFSGVPVGETFEIVLTSGDFQKVVTYTWKGPDVFEGFEVWQKSGYSTGPVPYDVFEGRAKPGSLITISSPYGGAEVEANAEGYWRLEVEFPDAPMGETFNIEVTDGTHIKTFTFLRKA